MQGLSFWRNASDFARPPFPEKMTLYKFPGHLLLAHNDIVPNLDKLQLPTDFEEKTLPVQGVLRFENWELTVQSFSAEAAELDEILAAADNSGRICLVDAEKICAPLQLRSGTLGRALAPVRSGGKRQKLSDFGLTKNPASVESELSVGHGWFGDRLDPRTPLR